MISTIYHKLMVLIVSTLNVKVTDRHFIFSGIFDYKKELSFDAATAVMPASLPLYFPLNFKMLLEL